MSKRKKPNKDLSHVVFLMQTQNARLRDLVNLAACAMMYVKLYEGAPTGVMGPECGAEYERMKQLVAKIEKGR